MDKKLLNKDGNDTFPDENIKQPSIELTEINTTHDNKAENTGAQFVKLEDISDVLCADESAKNECGNFVTVQSLLNQGTQKRLPNQEDSQITQQQQIMDDKQAYQNQQQLINPEFQNIQKQPSPNKFTNVAQMENNPQTSQIDMNQQEIINNISQFGLPEMNPKDLKEQVLLQQQILEDIECQKKKQASIIVQPQPNQPQSNQPYPPIQQQEMIAQIEVKCRYCKMMQKIPITSKMYQCFNCQDIQESNPHTPVYLMFMCGRCQSKVLYEPGLCEYIQCTRCSTVNKVPLDKSVLENNAEEQQNMLDKFEIAQQNKMLAHNIPQSEQGVGKKGDDNLSEEEVTQIEKQFVQLSISNKQQQQLSENAHPIVQIEPNEYLRQLYNQQLESIEQLKQQETHIQQQIDQHQLQLQQISAQETLVSNLNQPHSTSQQPILLIDNEDSHSLNPIAKKELQTDNQQIQSQEALSHKQDKSNLLEELTKEKELEYNSENNTNNNNNAQRAIK